MKRLMTFLTLAILALPAFAQYEMDHGGGNGGDYTEIELKKRALQISYFLSSPIGSKEFQMLNPAGLADQVNKSDFDVTEKVLIDKYGVQRTCLNYPERALIICNINILNELKVNRKEDILTALLFHEILGLLGLELGYQDNVSLYPISSKIIPYHPVILQTPISDADIKPEFFSVDTKLPNFLKGDRPIS